MHSLRNSAVDPLVSRVAQAEEGVVLQSKSFVSKAAAGTDSVPGEAAAAALKQQVCACPALCPAVCLPCPAAADSLPRCGDRCWSACCSAKPTRCGGRRPTQRRPTTRTLRRL